MAQERITIQLLGTDDDAGYLRLPDFIQQLEALRTTLSQVARVLDAQSRVYFRVVDLRLRSPATVVLEQVTRPAKAGKATARPIAVSNRVITDLQSLRQRHLPKAPDMGLLDTYRDLVDPLEEHRLSMLLIRTPQHQITLRPGFGKQLEQVVGPDELVDGSLTGQLDAVNIHDRARMRFDVYPVIGPSKVRCEFPDRLKSTVLTGIDRYVRVHGQLRYKSWAKFAHAITVRDLEILPESKDLPTLSDLRGIAPGLADAWLETLDDAWE